MTLLTSFVFLQNNYAAYLGILTACAIGLCIAATCLIAAYLSIPMRKAFICTTAGAVTGVLCSHIYYVFTSSPAPDMSQLFNLFSGFSLIALLAGYALGCALCALALGAQPLRLLDCTAAAMPAAVSLGMLGCVWTGEYIGSPVSINAMHFFPISVFCRGEGIWRYPLFWYMSVYCLLLCVFILFLLTKKRADSLSCTDGELFVLFAALYTAPAGIMETFRCDSVLLSPVFINKLQIMQSAQLSCAVLSAAAVLVLILRRAFYNRFALRTLWPVPVTILMYCGYCYDMLHIATVYDWLNTLWICISAAGISALAVYSFFALCKERTDNR